MSATRVSATRAYGSNDRNIIAIRSWEGVTIEVCDAHRSGRAPLYLTDATELGVLLVRGVDGSGLSRSRCSVAIEGGAALFRVAGADIDIPVDDALALGVELIQLAARPL